LKIFEIQHLWNRSRSSMYALDSSRPWPGDALWPRKRRFWRARRRGLFMHRDGL